MQTDITRAERMPPRICHEMKRQRAEERRILYDALTETLTAWADDPSFFVQNPGMHVVLKLMNLDSRPEFLEVFRLGERALGLDAMLKKIRTEIMRDLPRGEARERISNDLDRRNYNRAVFSSFCESVSRSPDALGIERAIHFLDEALTDSLMFTSQGARFFLAKLLAVLNKQRGEQDVESSLFSPSGTELSGVLTSPSSGSAAGFLDELYKRYFRKFTVVVKRIADSEDPYAPLWRRGAAYEFLSSPEAPEDTPFVKDVLAELKAVLKIDPELPSRNLRNVDDADGGFFGGESKEFAWADEIHAESPPAAEAEKISDIAAKFAQAVIHKLRENELQREEAEGSVLRDQASASESPDAPIPLTKRLTAEPRTSDDELRAQYNRAMFESNDLARSARAAEGSLFQRNDTDEFTPKPVNGKGKRVASFGAIISPADAAVEDRPSVSQRLLNFFR